MKDGFDRSVAEKMPKIQKKRPNRPWNVDPVLMKVHEEENAQAREAKPVPEEQPVSQLMVEEKLERAVPVETSPASRLVVPENGNVAKAVETIKDLSSDFTQMIFDRKAIQQELDKTMSVAEHMERENIRLKEAISELEKSTLDNSVLEREITFLNEQLEDADLYIQNMVNMLEEKAGSFEQEARRRKELEGRLENISKEIHEKAKMDVKISILERDLSISNTRVLELESRLEEEYQKREPLEQEIVELKNALDRVYSSLAQIRLKAKREVYGS